MNAVRAIVEMQQVTVESTGQSIREWFIAVGTVGATMVALYVGVFRERWRRPKLSLEYGGPALSDAVIISSAEVIGRPNAQDLAYVRLRVIAAKRRAAAEDVEVMILNEREVAPREGFPPRRENMAIAIGQLLVWSNTIPAVARLTIPPGTHRHLDLVCVDKGLTAAGLAPVEIEVDAVPAHQVKSGTFELELAVSARNADARRYRVLVSYDGKWDDDIWQHLSVQGPQLVR